MPAKGKKDELRELTEEEIIGNLVNSELETVGSVSDSFDDLLRLAEASGEGIIEFKGSIWDVADKDKLVDEPFIIQDVRYYDGKFGPTFAIMVVTKNKIAAAKGRSEPGDHFVINDGSTGIFQQVKQMVSYSGKKSGILCPNGLRKSEYDTTIHDAFDDVDREVHGVTYYVA